MTPATRRIAVVLAVGAAAALTACSSPLSSGPPPPTTAAPTTTTIEGASTPAQTKGSAYRAQLTYLMVEHVYLLSRVTQGIASAGASSASGATGTSGVSGTSGTSGPTGASGTTGPSGVAASAGAIAAVNAATGTSGASGATVGTLDDASAALATNSADIADWLSLAQGYGSSFDTAFLPLWQARNADFVDYATAKAAGDTDGVTSATDALTSNATAIATLFHTTNEYIPITTVTNPPTGLGDELGSDNSAVTAFIVDQATAASTVATDTVTAAEDMYHTADFLAAAAAKLDPDQYPGTVDGTAANLRSSVTMAWVEHVELAALNIDQIEGGQKAGVWSAALDNNTQQIEHVIASNLGDQAARQFGALWTSYIGSLRTYAYAESVGDTTTAASARGQLSGTAQAVGAFFAAQRIGLGADVISADVEPIISGLQLVADAATSHAPEGTLIRTAAGYVPKFGSDVSEAFAIANPTLFAP